MTDKDDAALMSDALADSDNPHLDDELIRRRRAPAEDPKRQVRRCLDDDAVDRLRADRAGWHAWTNAARRKEGGLKSIEDFRPIRFDVPRYAAVPSQSTSDRTRGKTCQDGTAGLRLEPPLHSV